MNDLYELKHLLSIKPLWGKTETDRFNFLIDKNISMYTDILLSTFKKQLLTLELHSIENRYSTEKNRIETMIEKREEEIVDSLCL